MVRAELTSPRTADTDHNFVYLTTSNTNSTIHVGEGGYSVNSKLDPAELLLVIAKYLLPFYKSVKSDLHF